MENKIQKNIILAPYTTYKIGGPADYFIIARNQGELANILRYAKEKNLPVTVLGGGSNVLISDQGVAGLVVLNKANNYRFSENGKELYAESGAILSKVARESVELGLAGLNFAAGIPGTIGGATVGNAGTPDAEISDILTEAEVWDSSVRKYKNEDFHFCYRYSKLKNSNKVVLSVKFELKKGDRTEMLKKIQNDAKRRAKLYRGLTCGSYFKNPDRISAGELIDKAGLKGFILGQAKVSENHGNILINTGEATAKEMIELEQFIISKVRTESGITLEPEVVKIGRF